VTFRSLDERRIHGEALAAAGERHAVRRNIRGHACRGYAPAPDIALTFVRVHGCVADGAHPGYVADK
jgi:hypothetical protein